MDSGAGDELAPDDAGPQVDVPEGAEDVEILDVPESESAQTENDVPEAQTPIKMDSGTCQNDVPEASEGDVPEGAEDVPEMVQGWRVEVTNAGIYWQWRKGSHGNRQARKGGKFITLSKERQKQYEHNKREHHDRRRAAKGRSGERG